MACFWALVRIQDFVKYSLLETQMSMRISHTVVRLLSSAISKTALKRWANSFLTFCHITRRSKKRTLLDIVKKTTFSLHSTPYSYVGVRWYTIFNVPQGEVNNFGRAIKALFDPTVRHTKMYKNITTLEARREIRNIEYLRLQYSRCDSTRNHAIWTWTHYFDSQANNDSSIEHFQAKHRSSIRPRRTFRCNARRMETPVWQRLSSCCRRYGKHLISSSQRQTFVQQLLPGDNGANDRLLSDNSCLVAGETKAQILLRMQAKRDTGNGSEDAHADENFTRQ